MKQKLVIELNMCDEKRRSKAMKTVVGAEGCVSVALDEKDKRKLVVIGENMDAVELVTSLRKKHFCAKVMNLEEMKSEKKDEGVKKPEENKPVQQWPCIYQPSVPQPIFYQAVHPAAYYEAVHPAAYYEAVHPDPCSIM